MAGNDFICIFFVKVISKVVCCSIITDIFTVFDFCICVSFQCT